jgi:hypothetical protein
MAYTATNFKSKKELKQAVGEWTKNGGKMDVDHIILPVRCYQPGLGPDPDLSNFTGRVALEGPHYPKPHSWYADCNLVDGIVTKVR